MSLYFDKNRVITPDYKRYYRLNLITIFTVTIITSGISVLQTPLIQELRSKYNLDEYFHTYYLEKILVVYIEVISALVIAAILTSLLITWLNVCRSNLMRQIVENLHAGRGLNKSYYGPTMNSREYFHQADDEKLEVKVREKSVFYWFVVGVTAVLAILFTLRLNANQLSRLDCLLLLLITTGIVILIYNLMLRTIRISFNRLEGTVTYFGFLLPWHRKVKFNKVHINAYDNTFKLIIPYRFIPICIIGQYQDAQAWWSYYVWYMDRNRPLPPGTLLDAYREKDYLRRKSEGFPQPLYYSSFETSEWSGAITQYNDQQALQRNATLYAGSQELLEAYEKRKKYLEENTYLLGGPRPINIKGQSNNRMKRPKSKFDEI